jgi:hypothetical protein
LGDSSRGAINIAASAALGNRRAIVSACGGSGGPRPPKHAAARPCSDTPAPAPAPKAPTPVPTSLVRHRRIPADGTGPSSPQCRLPRLGGRATMEAETVIGIDRPAAIDTTQSGIHRPSRVLFGAMSRATAGSRPRTITATYCRAGSLAAARNNSGVNGALPGIRRSMALRAGPRPVPVATTSAGRHPEFRLPPSFSESSIAVGISNRAGAQGRGAKRHQPLDRRRGRCRPGRSRRDQPGGPPQNVVVVVAVGN